jgi:hypothetical protein
LIPTLQTEGHDVIASQHGLDSFATDVAAVKASHVPMLLKPDVVLDVIRKAARAVSAS